VQTETEPVRLKHQIWYAPKVKRLVKHARNTYAPKGNDLDRDLHELMNTGSIETWIGQKGRSSTIRPGTPRTAARRQLLSAVSAVQADGSIQ
jgi:hypothetical protein